MIVYDSVVHSWDRIEFVDRVLLAVHVILTEGINKIKRN